MVFEILLVKLANCIVIQILFVIVQLHEGVYVYIHMYAPENVRDFIPRIRQRFTVMLV